MVSLVVHGGAWDIPDEKVAAHREGIMEAVKEGWAVLSAGGSACAAVERAVSVLENDETFNAGHGSAINAAGEVELDASIMDGKALRAGAVAAVQRVANPITLARLVMEKSEHVLLVGMGAARFAQEHGLPLCGKDALITGRALEHWRMAQLDQKPAGKTSVRKRRQGHDTVGAVAMDKSGNIASGTSTGGTPNKYPGRVGDSPLIGSGTYADNKIGGVSTTGWGEGIIKVVMAKSIIDLMERNGGDPERAVCDALVVLERKVNGSGGAIVLNREGKIGVAFNTRRMARGYMTVGMRSPVVQL